MIATQDTVFPYSFNDDSGVSTFNLDGTPAQSTMVTTSVSKPQSDPGSTNKVYQEVRAGALGQADVITDVKSWIERDGTVRFGLTIVRDPDADPYTDSRALPDAPSFVNSKDYCFEDALYQSLFGNVRTDLRRGASPLDDFMKDHTVACRNMYLSAITHSHHPMNIGACLDAYLEDHKDTLAIQAFGTTLPNEHPHLAAYQDLPTVGPTHTQQYHAPARRFDLTPRMPQLEYLEQYLERVQRPQLAYMQHLQLLQEACLPHYPECKWPFWPGQQNQPFQYQQRIGYPVEMEWESTSNSHRVIGSHLLQPTGDPNFSVSDLARWWHEVGQYGNM